MEKIPTKLKDFRNFLYLVWKHLALPRPTQVQYDIANFIQSKDKRIIINAFRGVGKSWITSAYVCHQLLLNPQLNILVVSASKNRADDFSTFTLRLINEIDVLAHLRPSDDQRQSKVSFDVKPARASHAPSVKSLGITGQLTGSRSDLVIADDVESANNSATMGMRDKLSEQVKEFESIIKPQGRIIFLGTPQTEMSLYNQLPNRGYKLRVWTARYPTEKQVRNFGDTLAPIIRNTWSIDEQGKPTDPDRFDEEDLNKRQLSYGASGFNLQFMLDTSISDANKYPLKLSDLVVMSLNPKTAPEKVIWASSPELKHEELPCVGLHSDAFYRPMQIQGDWMEYQGSVLAIDPSGRGDNETSYCCAKMLNGNVYITDAGGLVGGYTDKTLQSIATIAKQQEVNLILVEENYGGGMFTKLLLPFVTKTYPVTIEEIRHQEAKEKRIIDTLEPLMQQHRLIIDSNVVHKDYNSANEMYALEKALRYQMFYQMSRISNLKGSLAIDDRLDVLGMACRYWVDQLARDQHTAQIQRREELLNDELDRFLDTQQFYKRPSDRWM
ncbi:phage terminase large subunit [Candidatus Pelagibacter communis]|jgi:hypothetical protein|uniref:phage terminase large subunit n=1 Tax=Pelagibacter ubique TaxID=198252 RepID=UPI00094D1387|nr:phage terminase large subunit [Candidatus Pelagibacter ubique]|tara:strand:- start:763 stop:2427 length:1665 start_codon:yes stop_codon:yes gene_type:complete